MGNFIYVFTKEAFNKLIESGYVLLKADEKNLIYVFENKQELTFNLSDEEFIFSNTLTF